MVGEVNLFAQWRWKGVRHHTQQDGGDQRYLEKGISGHA